MARRYLRKWWWISVPLALAGYFVVWHLYPGGPTATALESDERTHNTTTPQKDFSVRVEVVLPKPSGLERSTTQPVSVHAFDFAELYSKVSGYLKQQLVDIGDHVKKGQLLAEIEAPEFQSELDRANATLLSAQAKMNLAEAGIKVAIANRDAAEATLKQSQAAVSRDTAALTFRNLQYKRISELWKLHSIDEQLVDEKEDQRLAAQAALDASKAAVSTAEAMIVQADANIDKAKADFANAQAEVNVAKAAVERARIYTEYLKITSPYDGIVSQRDYHVGDFIREATQGATTPLFTVTLTDKMRVIVQIPDLDVPYTDRGDPAIVEVDALAGVKFKGAVSRIANSEDPTSRTMRAEIDVPNPDNHLRDGMYGYATVILQKASAGMTIPSSCLVGDAKNGRGHVYVVKDGRAHLTEVEVGHDNGIEVEITSGLVADAEVVRQYSGAIGDGVPVTVSSGNAEVAATAH